MGFVAILVRICVCIVVIWEANRCQYGIYFLLEMFLLTILFRVAPKYFRLVAIPVLSLHILQFVNVIHTGYWIDANTLQNLAEFATVGNKTIFLSIFWFVVYAIFWFPDLIHKPLTFESRRISEMAVPLAVIMGLFVIKGVPVHKFIIVTMETWDVLSYQIKGDEEVRRLFSKTSFSTKNIKQCKNCNVILLFAEGTSSCVISEDLMPNTYKFLNDSLSYKNYFNHQAATFRGIRGSLTSGFTYRGGHI